MCNVGIVWPAAIEAFIVWREININTSLKTCITGYIVLWLAIEKYRRIRRGGGGGGANIAKRRLKALAAAAARRRSGFSRIGGGVTHESSEGWPPAPRLKRLSYSLTDCGLAGRGGGSAAGGNPAVKPDGIGAKHIYSKRHLMTST